MDDEKFNINMRIDGYPVRLHIARKDEEIYRNAERDIKDIYKKLNESYPNKSVVELWLLTALQVAVTINRQQKVENINPLAQKIEELEQQIDQLLFL